MKPQADYTRDELREIVKAFEVPGRGAMSKAQMLEILRDLRYFCGTPRSKQNPEARRIANKRTEDPARLRVLARRRR